MMGQGNPEQKICCETEEISFPQTLLATERIYWTHMFVVQHQINVSATRSVSNQTKDSLKNSSMNSILNCDKIC